MINLQEDTLPNRLLWIDYSKGVGITLVVYGHVLRGLNEIGIVRKSYFYYSDTFIYSFHMPLFFIISGLFFVNSVKKYGDEYLLKKAKILLYPFVIWSLIQVTIQALMSRYTNVKVPFSAILNCLIVPSGQFWFLYALFFIHCINFLIYKYSKRYALVTSMVVWIIGLIINFQFIPVNDIFKYLVFFNIGIILFHYKKLFLRLVRGSWALILALLFIIAEYLYFGNFKKQTYFFDFLYIITGTAGSLLIMQLCNKALTKKIFTFLRTLGEASIAIYLMHILVASGTRIFLVDVLKINSLLINLIAGTILGLIVPILVYNVCMKNYYLSWLFLFKGKRNNQQRRIIT